MSGSYEVPEDNNNDLLNPSMVLRLLDLCRRSIDLAYERGADDLRDRQHQELIMLLLFTAARDTEYKQKLFDLWPTYHEDISNEVNGCHAANVIAKEFMKVVNNKDSHLLDVACGPGNIAQVLRDNGYKNIDGLDPSATLLNVGKSKGLFDKTFQCFVQPDDQTPITDENYDGILRASGMFPGGIVPSALTELIRITKRGGIIGWTLAGCPGLFEDYLEKAKELEKQGLWESLAVKKVPAMSNVETSGYVLVMRRN